VSRLYDITGNILTLQELLESPLEDEDILKDTLEAIQGEYEAKIEAYCKVIKNIEADMEALKTEAKRLTDKRKVLENNVDRLKKAMFESMKATNTPKVSKGIFTVSIQRNGGKLPVIVDVETADLPHDCIKVQMTPDLEAIAKLIDSGNTQYAHYGERGESLRIK
jgi:predicted nuclease with TOPRIM domain